MLGVIQSKLRALGLVRPQSQTYCNVSIKLDNVLIDLFDDQGRYLYLRVAETYDLQAEYKIAKSVWQMFEAFVPRPLEFFREQGLSCIVFEGVDFQFVRGRDLLAAGVGDRLGRGMLDFFAATMSSRGSGAPAPEVDCVLAGIDERFAGTEHECLWQQVRAGLDLPYLASLPSLRQHGDFVPNNLGSRKSRIIIFDWEDFGKVCLPGFDLAVLLASCVDFDSNELRRVRDADGDVGSGTVPWLREAFGVLELDALRFWRSVPFHLFLFLCLKDRYSPAIRAKVVRAIQGLL